MSLSYNASISPPWSPDSEKQAETNTRKRKRDDAESDELDRRPFTIRVSFVNERKGRTVS